ncbi:MAG: M48 family metalloprotease [Bacteroidetes bacterium]|nr:M48 family metalloprotease [Bacteroidota bacterium]
MDNNLYPPAPAGSIPEKLVISPAFRKQVSSVAGSIFLFLLVYLLLVAAAIALAIACCWIGLSLIIAFPKFITLLIGLGLIGVGISVLVFLFKFIFAVARDENSQRIEITEAEHPQLFAFIRRLTEETRTPFPKKIFLTPDVNAAVFYNSSFWSMFLPVRKNLQIGLGLVNSVNISEFKAVMAHEFGHFSQRSMKLGSFTYNVNRVIHNMLYENNSYTAFLNAWGNLHGYLRFFAGITVKIAEGIQWILRGMYTFVNRSYQALSREMEFHADAVAASVAGGNNVISALSRSQVASSCYARALDTANDKLRQNEYSRNIFSNQLTVLRSMADDYGLPLKSGLPEVSYSFIQSFSISRINYKDQWASHPTLTERKEHLDQVGIEATPDSRSPWLLFDHPEALQEKLTKNLYREVKLKENAQEYDGAAFETWYVEKKRSYAFPNEYKGFYDNRYIQINDWNFSEIEASQETLTFDQLFNEETGRLQSSIGGQENDLETVNAINDGRLDVSSFDFDGVKYSSDDTPTIIGTLKKDIETTADRQRALDKQAYRFFLDRAADPELIRNSYRAFQSICLHSDEYENLVNAMLKTVEPFYTGGLTLEQLNGILRTIKEQYEPDLKKAYRQLIDDGMLTKEENEKLYDALPAFSEKDYRYFVDGKFQNNELDELRGLAIQTAEHLHRRKFASYKRLLEQQLSA